MIKIYRGKFFFCVKTWLVANRISPNIRDNVKLLTHTWPILPFHIPLKTPENQRFSGALRGYKMGILVRIGLMVFVMLI